MVAKFDDVMGQVKGVGNKDERYSISFMKENNVQGAIIYSTTFLTFVCVSKFISTSQHSYVKTYSECIFRGACLCNCTQLSLILPTLL